MADTGGDGADERKGVNACGSCEGRGSEDEGKRSAERGVRIRGKGMQGWRDTA